MTAPTAETARRTRIVLLVVLAFSILSTALHYTHNAIQVAQYPAVPGIPNWVVQAGIVVAWPLLTIAGIHGYRLQVAGRYWPARGWLLVYSLTGLATLGRFLVGVPRIPPFWFATLFTDAFAALALWAYVVWSAIVLDPGGRRPTPAELAAR